MDSVLEGLGSPPGLGSESSADADDDEQVGSPRRRLLSRRRPQRLWSLLQANRSQLVISNYYLNICNSNYTVIPTIHIVL